MRIVLLGAPGSGKGTQATRLNERYGMLVISPNIMLREAALQDTPPGRQAKGYMDLRQPVPDDVVCAVLKDRLRRPAHETLQERPGSPVRQAQVQYHRRGSRFLQSRNGVTASPHLNYIESGF